MSAPSRDIAPLSYEAAVAELDAIVTLMEDSQLPLEKSLEAYRRGTELLKYCQAQLADAQQKVRILEQDALQTFTGSDN